MFPFSVEKLQAVFTLLDAFGNSRTIMNTSASKYTSITSLDFDHSGQIAAASVQVSNDIYRQVSNIRHTLVGNKIVDHSDVVGASPVGAASHELNTPQGQQRELSSDRCADFNAWLDSDLVLIFNFNCTHK